MSGAVQVFVDTEVSAPTANRRAVAELFAEHSRYVWRVLRHLGIRDRDTDDLCQEIFLITLRRIDSLHSQTAAPSVALGIDVFELNDFSTSSGLNFFKGQWQSQIAMVRSCVVLTTWNGDFDDQNALDLRVPVVGLRM